MRAQSMPMTIIQVQNGIREVAFADDVVLGCVALLPSGNNYIGLFKGGTFIEKTQDDPMLGPAMHQADRIGHADDGQRRCRPELRCLKAFGG